MDDLLLLEDLDTHGFEVEMLKDWLNKLLMFKNEEEKVKNMLRQRERVLFVHVQENRMFKETKAKVEERSRICGRSCIGLKDEEY